MTNRGLFATWLGIVVAALLFTGCGGGGGNSVSSGSGGGTAPDLSAQTASARLDFNQSVAKGRQETRSSILPAGTDTLSVVGLDVGGSKVFGPQEYPRPTDDVLSVTVPVTVTRLLVTARAGQVDLTTFATEPKLKLGMTVTVPYSEFSVVGVVIKSMQTSKMPALIGATDLTATVSTESPKGLSLTYAWETTGGFVVTSAQPFGNSVTITAPSTYSATGTVKVTVRDSEGATASGTLALSTVAKDAPVISSITVNPQPVITVADIVATVLDPLGGPLSYSWTLGGVPLTGNSDRVQWTSPGIPGACEVSLRATGVTGLFTDSTKAFTIDSSNPWPCRGQDLQGTRRSPYNAPANTGTVQWRYQIAAPGYFWWSSPAVGADGTIYIGACGDYKLYAVNPDGSTRWSFLTGGHINSAPTIGADGTIYVGSADKKVYAIGPDGSLKWSCEIGGAVAVSSPAIGADGTLYVGAEDGKLYAIRGDGSIKWTYQTGNYIYSCPAIGSDGTVCFGSYDKKVYALHPDGSLKWQYLTRGAVSSSPAIAPDGTIYIGSWDNDFYALRPDGTVKWTYTTVGGVYISSPAIAPDGTVYVGARDNNLYALRPDGTLKWLFAAKHWFDAAPAVAADGTVYAASVDKSLYALGADGSLKWSVPTLNQIWSSPAIGADGTVYVGSSDRTLYAIK